VLFSGNSTFPGIATAPYHRYSSAICFIGLANDLRALMTQKTDSVGKYNPGDGDGRVIVRLSADWVELREAKRDRGEGNPEYGSDRDGARELALMERPSHESLHHVYDAHGDENFHDRDNSWRWGGD